ncbi:hypothetical protein DITRI_Ditri05aG0160800 [Diplodiscus trichospermus]
MVYVKTRDRQWVFFTPRDKKYPNGARSNRGTGHGYWKAIGKDHTVTAILEQLESRKLCFSKEGVHLMEYYTFYKLYKKSGPSPKNGDEAAPPQSQAHSGYVLPQVACEEETQSTLLDPSPRDVLFPELQEVSEVTSVTDHFEDISQLYEENFLEINNLIGPKPFSSNIEKSVENGQFNGLDGLSEFDLYHDVAMFLLDIRPIDQGTVPFPYDNMINQTLQLQLNASGDNMLNQVGCQSQSHYSRHLMDQQLISYSTCGPSGLPGAIPV